MTDKWFENLDEEGLLLTNLIVGFVNDIENCFAILEKKIDKENLEKAKISLVATLHKVLTEGVK